MGQLQVVPVEGRSLLNRFVDLPWQIYKDYPNWVPPLRFYVKRLLNTSKHPFWHFSQRELFIALRGDRPVGRIAAIVDNNSNAYRNETGCTWGFFECENNPETAEALFSAAATWARSHGMTFLRGPLNPSTNYEIGTLVEGFEHPPVIMMTYNPPYYDEIIRSCGFAKEKDVIALRIEADHPQSQRIERLAERLMKKSNVSIRKADVKNLETEVRLIADIYAECWADNWGFVPMTNEELMESAAMLRRIADPDLIFFPMYNDVPAGVAMILPDINPLLKRLNGRLGVTGLIKTVLYKKEITGLRGVLFGIRKAYQKLGVPLVAFDYCNKILRNTHYQYMELGWNLEDNMAINQFDQEVGGKVYKRYRIYRKDMAQDPQR